MKSSKIWKIIWVVGLYALLSVILYLVVLYKVEWEYKDLNTYLYVYDCGNEICTSTTVQNDYYGKVLCEEGICPHVVSITGNNIIFKREDVSWIYDYINAKIVSNSYINYRYIGNNMYVVCNEQGSYGVIDSDGDVLVDLKYDYIDDYKNGYISYVKNNLYGIVNEDNNYKIDSIYEDVVLINDKIFAGRIDNIYQLHSYDNINNNNSNKYNYVYSFNDVILVVNNKKIDILDNNLNSTLLMKIDTFYNYTIEKERDSLKISTDENNIYFRVFINETEYTEYIYNIKNKKLV